MNKKQIKTGDKNIDRLYQSVIDYVKKNKGSVDVIGGIAIVDEGKKNKYGVMIRVLGRKPIFKK